jgi:putative ABC transport system permease protein
LGTLTIITGIIAGSYPAFYLSSFDPVKVLKGFTVNRKTSLSVRKVLVVFQFVFATCLIICTAVIYRQLNYIKNKPIGYNQANLIQFPAHGNLKDLSKLNLLKEQLLKSGAASKVSFFSSTINTGGNNTSNIEWQGKDPKAEVIVNFRNAGNDFVETIGSQMLEGREFSPLYTDSNSVVVNEALLKVMGYKNPVGRTLKVWGNEYKIIGVIKDFVIESAYAKTGPMVMFVAGNDDISTILVRLNSESNIGASLTKIDAIVKNINPDYPVDRVFVDEVFAEKFRNEQLLGTLSNWFAGFAILISCLGLLGLALYMAEQRKKEISIRKVLGANAVHILTLLNKDFLMLVLWANMIAIPLAYIISNRWLTSYEFRTPISILPFALAIGLSTLIAILTVSIQSIKVAKANPIDALKYE